MTEAAVGSDLVGKQLDDLAGVSVGRVEGVMVDPETSAVEWVIVRAARFGGRTLVPARDAVPGVDSAWVPFNAERIRSAPKQKGDLTQAAEMELLRHFGIAGPAGRAAEIAERPADAPSAVAR
jgi:sporulation protein YlmC with PRC-barrel domain